MEGQLSMNLNDPPKKESIHHHVKMGLGIDFQKMFKVDGMNKAEIGEKLINRRDELRKKIMQRLIEWDLPQSLELSKGNTISYDRSDLETNSNIDYKYKSIAKTDQGFLGVNHELKLDVDIKINRPIDIFAALQEISPTLAFAAADNIIFALEDIYLGKRESDSEFSNVVQNGDLTDFDYQEHLSN